MYVWGAALVLVGTICVLNLVLTLGVIARLRTHTELLSLGGEGGPLPALPVGGEVGAFTARTVDGEPLSHEALDGDTVVAFFSPTCKPCRENLPAFVRFAREAQGGTTRTLAVVVSDAERAASFVSELSPVTRVAVETRGGPLCSAFGVSAFPATVRVAPDDAGKLRIKADRVALDQSATVAA
ncbi:TlpA disulfide reductase family protein [Streptomyces sp. NPDC059788]|uniref:TlpA disulfide reductase family protein n=1 Tax=Streptomyces sp. NPDC059788 TaxID=3346948 RepID=UPI0036612A23